GDGREFYRKVDIQQSYAQNQTVQNFKQYIKFVHNVLTNKPPVVFLFIPLSFVVRPADVIRVAHHGSRIDPFEKRRALELLSRTLNSNQVDMIDPTSALAEKDKKARMYNLFDVHLTKSGNEAVADF